MTHRRHTHSAQYWISTLLLVSAGLLAVCWILVLCMPRAQGLTLLDPLDPYTGPSLMEDDPDWDCRTMGNQICGLGGGYPYTLIQFLSDGQILVRD